MTTTEQRTTEAQWARALIEELVRQCPRRVAGSEDERRALELVRQELVAVGLDPQWQPFRTNPSLYAVLALHFGLGALGSVVSLRSPLAAALLHGLAGSSYLLDSTRRAFLLRRLLLTARSHNMVVTLPAEGEPALRLVLMAHIDAAFTGLMFHESVTRRREGEPEWMLRLLGRPLATATWSQLALGGLDLLRSGPLRTSRIASMANLALGLPGALTFLLNLEVLWRNQAVAGANDDLSGVAGMILAVQRLMERKPAEVELVLAVTGAEEAGLMGARALALEHEDEWDRDKTVVLALDSLCHGDLRVYAEGEIIPVPLARWLLEMIDRVGVNDSRFSGVRPYEVPAGGSDALVFAARGYDALGFGRIAPERHTPQHYHLPSDTPENLDMEELLEAVDFTEQLIDAIIARRLGRRD